MNRIEFGDCREIMRKWKDEGIKAQTCVTSPPYWGLRDYGCEGQIGQEDTPPEYVYNLVEVFRCVWDILKDDGTLWLNLGDTYNGNKKGNTENIKNKSVSEANSSFQKKQWDQLKQKDLIGIPWRVAFALQDEGWYLRQDIIWKKPNPMPESVTDRCTKSHEYLFLLTKKPQYYFDHEAIKEVSISNDPRRPYTSEGTKKMDGRNSWKSGEPRDGEDFSQRNKHSVWEIAPKPYPEAHYAVFPPKLVLPCILAGSKEGDIVLDPFMGSGTTAMVAKENGRGYLGCDLNPKNEYYQNKRIASVQYQRKLF